jgi:hypothetical protein
MDKHPHPTLGEQKGFGARDYEQDTTVNIHSAAIMENLYTSKDVVSQAEVNPNVFVHHYDYEAYDPHNQEDDVYWDPNMKDQLGMAEEGCNFSYASMGLMGVRKHQQWKAGGSSDFVILSNRGPEMGVITDQMIEDGHNTFKMFKNPESWAGNAVHNDGAVVFLDHFLDAKITFRDHNGQAMDNLFGFECTSDSGVCTPYGRDSWNVIVTRMFGQNMESEPQHTLEWDHSDDL